MGFPMHESYQIQSCVWLEARIPATVFSRELIFLSPFSLWLKQTFTLKIDGCQRVITCQSGSDSLTWLTQHSPTIVQIERENKIVSSLCLHWDHPIFERVNETCPYCHLLMQGSMPIFQIVCSLQMLPAFGSSSSTRMGIGNWRHGKHGPKSIWKLRTGKTIYNQMETCQKTWLGTMTKPIQSLKNVRGI